MAGPWEKYGSTPSAAPGQVIAPNQIKVDEVLAGIGSTQTNTAGKQISNRVAAATAPADIRKAQADADKAALEGGGLSPEVRKAAINAYNGAITMGSNLSSARNLYPEGPGSTQGIRGLLDYLPFTENQQFDSAANRMRGDAITAKGFTSGQTNTPREMEMTVGAMIPKSEDRDPLILDKLDALDALRRQAITQSIQTLGGIPDANGKITPASPAQIAALIGQAPGPQGGNTGGAGPGGLPPTGGVPPSGGTDGGGIGPGGITNQGQMVADPALAGVNAHVRALINQGQSAAQIRAYLNTVQPGLGQRANSVEEAVTARRTDPRRQINLDLEKTWQPASPLQQGLGAVAMTPLGTGAINAADMISAGTLDNMTSNPAMTRAVMSGVSAQNPNAALVGQIAGGALSAAAAEGLAARAGLQGVNAARAADTLYGAAYGAGSADDGSRLGGAALGGVGGAVGGMFGRTLARGAGRLVQGVRNPDAQALYRAGVPLTTGQALGGEFKATEDRLAGLPIVGGAIRNRRLEGMEGFNRVAFDQALAPINASTNGVIGEAGVDAARAARTQGYANALDGQNFTIDPQYTAEMGAARQYGAQIPQLGPQFDAMLTHRVDSLINNGQLTGRGFQDAQRGIRRGAAAARNDIMGYEFGQGAQQAENALRGLVTRQAPDVVPALDAANAANRGVEIVRDAVNRARSGTRVGEPGVFAPSQLNDAAAANSRMFGGTQGTTNQPFFDLTRAGQRVLPSNIPDSGTAGRYALAATLGLGGGAAGGSAGYAGGDGGFGDAATGAAKGIGAGLLTAAPFSRAAQRALTATLLHDRPAVIQAVGRGIENRAANAGQITIPTILQLLSGQQ